MGSKRSIIPNACTMSNLVAGFFAIIFASKGTGLTENTAYAAILIFIASIFDLLDGSLARALKVDSPIGVQLDSLADGISYGIAPGFISYQAYLYDLPEIYPGFNLGMLIAVIFPVCATFRLAKFNIIDSGDGFTGLPSPPAGLLISTVPALPFASILFIGQFNYSIPLKVFIPFYIITGLLMVSNIDYTKLFSDIMKKGIFPTILTVGIIIGLLIFAGLVAVFFFTLLYVSIGIVRYFFKLASN